MITATNAIKSYSRILKRMVNSIWKLLLINMLILAMVLYTLIFTDAQRHRDFYLHDSILNWLTVYFILFPCLKALIHMASLYLYRTQLDSYKLQMAEIISEHDYIIYIERPLRKIQTLFLCYPLVILAHAAIAFTCYYLKTHFL
jgi:hypothetical protein